MQEWEAVKQNNEGRERNRGNVKFVGHNIRSVFLRGFEESQRALGLYHLRMAELRV